MTATEALLLAQAIASGAMCGIIWFVQVVHYPLFSRIGAAESAGHAAENQRRTAWVVIPPMLVEAAGAAVFAVHPPAGIGRLTALAGLALVLVLGLSTALVQMPLHRRLRLGDTRVGTVAALVRTNWVRTILWTARAILAAWMLRAAG